MKPVVSIIVTTYNIESYVRQCIDSILRQTYQNFEIILVDDGSTDDTLAVAERCLRFDAASRRTVIQLPQNTPGGVGIPANIGVSAAIGKYIFYVDGDDWCEPTMLEELVHKAEDAEADLVIAGFNNYDDRNKRIEVPKDNTILVKLAAECGELPMDSFRRTQILRLNAVPWRKLYRADFLRTNEISFPEGEFFFEDNPYHWFNVLKAERIAFLPKVICHHRINRPGQTVGVVGRELLWFYDHYDTIKKWLTAEGQYDEYKLYLLGWIIGQTEWVVSKLLPEFYIDLFRRLIQLFDGFTEEEVVRALLMKGTGQLGWALVRGVVNDDLTSFAHSIRFRDENPSAQNKRIMSQLNDVTKQIDAVSSRLERADDSAARAAMMEIIERRSLTR